METVVINADPLAARNPKAPAPGSNPLSWLPCWSYSRRETGMIRRGPSGALTEFVGRKFAYRFHVSPQPMENHGCSLGCVHSIDCTNVFDSEPVA